MNFTNRLLSVRIPIALLALIPMPVMAVDYTLSGFGTAAFARSDQSYNYERFTNRDGTVKRDSILGAQLNADLNSQWGATLQATIAPSSSDNSKLAASMTWAFLSYRPTNNLLFRAGKLRMPLYLFSESMSVGASYDVMHLPTEVYSTAPTTDFTGASFSKTWGVAEGELALEGYWGTTKSYEWSASSIGEITWSELHTESRGGVLSYKLDDNTYRIGIQRAFIEKSDSGSVQTVGTVGVGGPGPVPTTNSGDSQEANDTRVFLLGIDQNLGNDFRLLGEFARRHSATLVVPKNTYGAYLTLLKKIGPWTPYVTVARLLTDKEARVSKPGAVSNFDNQSSWSVGASYRISPNQKIKAEWMRTHFNGSSSLVDQSISPSNQTLNVYSMSYNFAF